MDESSNYYRIFLGEDQKLRRHKDGLLEMKTYEKETVSMWEKEVKRKIKCPQTEDLKFWNKWQKEHLATVMAVINENIWRGSTFRMKFR